MSKILHGANMEINFYPHSTWLKGSDFHGYVCEICNSVWIYNLAQLLGKSWYQSDGRKEDSPLVINPLWSVSSFRNSSRISCSSFWSNTPISGVNNQNTKSPEILDQFNLSLPPDGDPQLAELREVNLLIAILVGLIWQCCQYKRQCCRWCFGW